MPKISPVKVLRNDKLKSFQSIEKSKWETKLREFDVQFSLSPDRIAGLHREEIDRWWKYSLFFPRVMDWENRNDLMRINIHSIVVRIRLNVAIDSEISSELNPMMTKSTNDWGEISVVEDHREIPEEFPDELDLISSKSFEIISYLQTNFVEWMARTEEDIWNVHRINSTKDTNKSHENIEDMFHEIEHDEFDRNSPKYYSNSFQFVERNSSLLFE